MGTGTFPKLQCSPVCTLLANMESLKPVLLIYGAKGLMLLRKSQHVLKLLVQKHRGKLLAGLAVGMGATAYLQTKLSKNPPQDVPKPVCDKTCISIGVT